jgi:hypothetical protein
VQTLKTNNKLKRRGRRFQKRPPAYQRGFSSRLHERRTHVLRGQLAYLHPFFYSGKL